MKLILMTILISGVSYAADPKLAAPKPAAPKAAVTTATRGKPSKLEPGAATGSRKKELNFEERVIEGLTGKGYESLTQTGNVDDGNRAKLYKKRADFDEETKNLLKEMEYLK